MDNIVHLKSGSPTITAEKFLERVDRGETDFRQLNQTLVTGEVNFGRRIVDTEVHLGKLIFLEVFNFCSANFLAKFNGDRATFREGVVAVDPAFADTVHYENVTCAGPFLLGTALYKKGLQLGNSQFLDQFNCGESTIEGMWFCERVLFKGAVRCNKLQVDHVDLGKSSFIYIFHCDEMDVKYCFDFGSATFVNHPNFGAAVFHCGNVTMQKDVKMDEPVFQTVSADSTPALAWVIYQFLAHRVKYNINHAPPHLQK